MTDLFAPPVEHWQRVSARLALVRRLLGAVAVVLVLGASTALMARTSQDPEWALPLVWVLVVCFSVWGWVWIGRVVRAWGYAEEEQELVITRGRLYKRLVIVPYGRMQFVDVSSGPIDQLLQIAKVHLHTASPVTSAVIPGLTRAEAARLRDRLTERGESTSAGL